jgi:putative oxidoreductase
MLSFILGDIPFPGGKTEFRFAAFVAVLGWDSAGRELSVSKGGRTTMSLQANRSSHPLLSCTDGFASEMTDPLLLIGRLLIAALFLLTAGFGSPTAGYLTFLHYVTPSVMSPLAIAAELVVVISLVLGLGTRYGALLGLLFVIIASVTAHRYWGYPAAQQGVQYIFLTKNLAIAGGLILLFVTGGGRISVDRLLAGKR